MKQARRKPTLPVDKTFNQAAKDDHATGEAAGLVFPAARCDRPCPGGRGCDLIDSPVSADHVYRRFHATG